MAPLKLTSLLAFSFFAMQAHAETSNDAGFSAMQGDFEYVVCSANSDVSVRNAGLDQEIFRASQFETVKPFQGWGENRKTYTAEGKNVIYVKVQFTAREGQAASIGWVPEALVQPRSRCQGAALTADFAPVETSGGLGDPNCCGFPIGNRPSASYHEAPRAFGSVRAGRTHAACDLYHDKADPILAVSPGTVLRSPYFFYEGTYAVEVKHNGGFVVRYGEVLGRSAPGNRQGAHVDAGQTVGYMGKTNCCTPMLHFELYSGAKTGPLTTGSGKYKRRSDLMDPTAYLDRWQQAQFRDQY